MNQSQKHFNWVKEAKYERVHTVRFPVCEVLEQVKPTYSEKDQNKSCFVGEEGSGN